jgi:hypothetical protein
MNLTGLHFLLTYQCTFECDHCFAWGSPWQKGVMTLSDIRGMLQQAQATGSVKEVYFEGGEPFMYYAVLIKAIQEARQMGFSVGVVSNSYWATSVEDAEEWLKPLAGMVDDLSISSDLFHFDEEHSQQTQNASAAAQKLGISLGIISVAQPEDIEAAAGIGQLPPGESGIMYRGRAAEKLTGRATLKAWDGFNECPYEDLRNPGRLHVDPLGYLHICQGITIGNLFHMPLSEICARYNPEEHPVVGPLLAGGPAELVRRYAMPHQPAYADACHLCYEGRKALRGRFSEILAPDQMYGVF